MEIYKDKTKSFEERAADLVSRMTLEEKIMQVGNNAASIPRLGVPFYDYWSEASHGFFGPFEFKEMDVTSYPVCLAMSQSWDAEKIKRVTTAISDECRAHYNVNGSELHMWCPTVNLARDPRNGRNDENFGEDPFLAGKLSAAYIRGMQEGDDKYLKTIATPKHYAVNSSENNRHSGSSNIDEATLREYYARVFEFTIKEGGAQSIMTSYNRINGIPASVNHTLLTTFLREEWGFDGFVVSDCGAVADCYSNGMFGGGGGVAHFYSQSLEEASAMSLIAGTDVSCGSEHKKALARALEQGYITEDIIDRSIIRAMISRFRLGLFEEKGDVSYDALNLSNVCTDEMSELSVDMANDTIVLMKNDNNLLPLDKSKLKKITVIGPNALYRQLGGYSAGQTPVVDTIVNIMALDGIRNEASGVEVVYEKGWCSGAELGLKGMFEGGLPGFDPSEMMIDILPEGADMTSLGSFFGIGGVAKKRHVPEDADYQRHDAVLMDRALRAAAESDVVVVVAGTDDKTASEERDRETLALPYNQDEKIQQIIAANPNTVVVLTTLGSVTGEFFDKAHTIVNAHFAGQAQGTAIANVLFGKVNPNAKLSATWYRDMSDLPHVNDYGIKKQDTYEKKARTYWHFTDPVLFPFGHGLSYSEFAYGNLKIAKTELDANETLSVSVDVTNKSNLDGAEVVQLYVTKKLEGKMRHNKPIRQLKGFNKVFIKAGETKTVTIDVPLTDITFWSNRLSKMVVENGTYTVAVGTSSANLPVSADITVSGVWNAKLYNVYADVSKYVYAVGETGKVSVAATLDDTTHICTYENRPVYASSDPSVATVDEQGVVTAKSAGTATITASVTYNGKTLSSKLSIAVK